MSRPGTTSLPIAGTGAGAGAGRLPIPSVTAVRLDEAPEAYARIDKGQATGKLVIVF